MAEKKGRHLGHFIIEELARNTDHVNQIDASTGMSKTNSSVLKSATSLARALMNFGLEPGDVITFSGTNHLDIRLPYFSGMMIGCPVAGVDPSFRFLELKRLFAIAKPKLSFCQRDSYEDTSRAARELNLGTMVVTFENGDFSLKEFIKKYGSDDNEEFVPPDFDPESTFAWLVSTSGTSGTPKLAAYYHKQIVETMKFCVNHFGKRNQGSVLLSLSPVQWMSAYFTSFLGIATNFTIVQTSALATMDNVIDIINKYKPTNTMLSPMVFAQLLRHPKPCDLTCFRNITIAGSKVHNDLMLEIRSKAGKNAVVAEIYSQSETLVPVLEAAPDGPIGNCGRLYPNAQAQLVDEDGKVIKEAHKPGELHIKGQLMAGYYNMPEETKNAFTPDGWFKTGDILYRDKDGYYFYVDRLKLLMKYKGYHILPCELEDVLRLHPGVLDVAVASIEDRECGELPTACVVRRHSDVTAKELIDIVAEKLSESKQLRGGVVFVEELPLTSTGKIARTKIREIVRNSTREY